MSTEPKQTTTGKHAWLTMQEAKINQDGPVTTIAGHVADWMRRHVVFEDGSTAILRAKSLTPPHATNLLYRIRRAF